MNRNNEAWKEGRHVLKNQVLPRNVNSYLPGLNGVYSRFIDYLRSARDGSNVIEDFGVLTPKLLTEGFHCLLICSAMQTNTELYLAVIKVSLSEPHACR